MGLSNYQAALTDSTFWASMGTTLKYVVVTLVLTNVVAFGLALLVTGGFKGQNFFRAGYFTPNLIGGHYFGVRMAVYFCQSIYVRRPRAGLGISVLVLAGRSG
ncbi:hypothetical protein HMSSN036_66530 [Paenibacillus macerans]|nr:hypothetical protein HMSSN036_66530 [Paenibacillus macerans]